MTFAAAKKLNDVQAKIVSSLPRKAYLSPPDKLFINDSFKKMPKIQRIREMRRFLDSVQRYISYFEYNLTNKAYNPMKKNIGMNYIAATAKNTIINSVPIRCVEATFLGAFLTLGTTGLIRFPVHFESRINNTIYRHIVLLVAYEDTFGALGLSRNENLMYKPMEFKSLYEILKDYHRSYNNIEHEVTLTSIGLPLSHNLLDATPITWRYLNLNEHNRTEHEELSRKHWKFQLSKP